MGKAKYLLPLIILALLISVQQAHSQVSISLPRIEVGEKGTGDVNLSSGLQVLFLLTALSLAPAFLLLMTSFTRIVIVLSLVRTAIAMHQTPPTQVVIGISLFLTLFVMTPTWQAMDSQAIQPYMAGEMNYQEAIQKGIGPIRDFMFKQVREKDLMLMIQMARIEKPSDEADVPTHVLIPAFIVSELNTAFRMGFMLFLPFIVVDMVIASILMSMGMMMLPPVMISLPFKILLFVMADGWSLVVKSLVVSFNY